MCVNSATNYYGQLEDADDIADLVKESKAKYIMSCNPISLGILKTPGEIEQTLQWEKGNP